MKKKFNLSLLSLALLCLSSTSLWAKGDNEKKSKNIELEFFQNKAEAINTFDSLLDGFMAENPNITVKQNQTPDAETVLMTRLASNRMPDSLSLNGNATYGNIAESGVLVNWKDSPLASRVHNQYIVMSQHLVGDLENIYGIPYTANASTVLYNIDIFNELNLSIPKTWTELIETAETLKKSGQTPFFHAFADSWTAMVPWNSLAANLQGETFFEDIASGKASFTKNYPEVAQKLYDLLPYGTKDNFGFGYSDGNTAFAHGETAMLIQGVWAIGEVKNANPNINLGVFALPATENEASNKLVSGVDSILAVTESSKNKEAAIKLMEYLTRESVSEQYIDEQKTFSAIKNVVQKDPVMDGIKEYFAQGKIASFPDHYYPTGMQVSNLVIEYLINGDKDKFLSTLDKEYQKVSQR